MAFVCGSNGFIGSHMFGIEEPGVICMAGISDTTCDDHKWLKGINLDWPHQLGQDCAKANLPFVYASSASVYGNGDAPLNLYAEYKLALDTVMQSYMPPGAHWYGLRFFNVYGKGEERKGKQASIVSRLRSGDLTEVFCPDTKRDFVHVSDCVAVARWLLQTLPPSGIYDVGTGVARSIWDVIEATGAPLPEIVDMPESLKGKYQFHTQASLTKLRQAGYDRPFLSLKEGVKLYT